MIDFINLTDEEFVIHNGHLSKERALCLINKAKSMDVVIGSLYEYCCGLDDSLSEDIEVMLDTAIRL